MPTDIRNRRFLVLAAMEDEIKVLRDDSRLKQHNVDFRTIGIGKVNAALATRQALDEVRSSSAPGHQINVILIGTAGGLNPTLRPGRLFITDTTAQHDVDAVPFAPHRGCIPFQEKWYWKSDPFLCRFALRAAQMLSHSITWDMGRMLSGDRFVRDAQDVHLLQQPPLKGDAVDMETAAVAIACESVPWISLKFITDNANETSPEDFQRFLHETRLHQRDHLLKMLELLNT